MLTNATEISKNKTFLGIVRTFDLYKDKKSGEVKTFDPTNPEDAATMKDPQFNQLFTKA